jgi:hypothetical protein
LVLGAVREPKPEHKAWGAIEHLDARVVQFGDSGDEAQTETITRSVATML